MNLFEVNSVRLSSAFRQSIGSPLSSPLASSSYNFPHLLPIFPLLLVPHLTPRGAGEQREAGEERDPLRPSGIAMRRECTTPSAIFIVALLYSFSFGTVSSAGVDKYHFVCF